MCDIITVYKYYICRHTYCFNHLTTHYINLTWPLICMITTDYLYLHHHHVFHHGFHRRFHFIIIHIYFHIWFCIQQFIYISVTIWYCYTCVWILWTSENINMLYYHQIVLYSFEMSQHYKRQRLRFNSLWYQLRSWY